MRFTVNGRTRQSGNEEAANKTLHPTATSIQFDFQASISPRMSYTLCQKKTCAAASRESSFGCSLRVLRGASF
jgi:hypothetical protein